MYIVKELEHQIKDGSTYFTTLVPKQTLQEAIDTIEALSEGQFLQQILRSVEDPNGMTVARAMECLQGIAAGTFTKDWLP